MKLWLVALAFVSSACGSSSSSPAPTTPPMQGPPSLPDTAGGRVHPFKIGSLDAYAVFDGTIDGPNDAKTFGVGQTPDAVAALLRAAKQPIDSLHLDITPLLVKSNGKVILFDAGAATASFARAGNLRASLNAAGVQREQVTDIFLSHGHADHALGLVVSGSNAFPAATIHMTSPEWTAMQKEAETDEEAKTVVAAIKSKVATFEPGAQVLPSVRAIDTHGHTPGHSSYEISDGPSRLFYLGDVAHHFVISVQRPGWDVAFDVDHQAANAMRAETIKSLAASDARVFAVHFPFPGLGYFDKTATGFAWKPE